METWFWILGWFLSLLTITGNKLTIFLGSFAAEEISAPKPTRLFFLRRGRFLCCS